MSYTNTMRKDTITVRLPDGYKFETSKYATKRTKQTGQATTITDVVVMALKKFLGL